MSAEELEALRFGTAILAGGLVAVITGVISFGYALKMHRQQVAERASDLRRALLAEIDENIERTGVDGAPIRITRSAWDEARQVEWPAETAIALRKAYADGEDLNSRIGIMDRYAGSPSGDEIDSASKRDQMLKNISDDCRRVAARAHGTFTAARDALRKI